MGDIRRLLEDIALGTTALSTLEIASETKKLNEKLEEILEKSRTEARRQLESTTYNDRLNKFDVQIKELVNQFRKTVIELITADDYEKKIDFIIRDFWKDKWDIMYNSLFLLAYEITLVSTDSGTGYSTAILLEADDKDKIKTAKEWLNDSKLMISFIMTPLYIFSLLEIRYKDKHLFESDKNPEEIYEKTEKDLFDTINKTWDNILTPVFLSIIKGYFKLARFYGVDLYEDVAMAFVKENKLEMAESYFKRALAVFPKEPSFVSGLCVVLNSMGKTSEAMNIIESRINSYPNDVSLLAMKGVFLEILKDWKNMDEWFYALLKQPICKDNKNFASLCHLNRAKALQKLQNEEESLYELKRAIEENPNLPEAYILLGEIYENKGELSQALESYMTAEKLGSFIALLFKSSIFVKEKKYEDARFSIKKYLESYPNNLKAHQLLLEIYKQQNNQEMIKKEEEILLSFKKQEETARIHGEVNKCFQEKEIEKAIKIIEDGLQINSNDLYLLSMGVVGYGVLKKWNESKKMIDAMQIQNITDNKILNTLKILDSWIGVIYFAVGDINNARAWFEKTLDSDIESNFYTGWYFYKENNTEKALNLYYKYITEKKKGKEINYINEELKEYEQKMKQLLEHMKLLGEAMELYIKKNIDGAISILENITKQNPKDKYAYHNLAVVYRKKGSGILGLKKEWKDKVIETENVAEKLGLPVKEKKWLFNNMFKCITCKGDGFVIINNDMKMNCDTCDGIGYEINKMHNLLE